MAAFQRQGPLNGVVVVDLSRQLAGPQCSRILSDFGARVIRVEQAGGVGDLLEASPHFFQTLNHSKERVMLDLRSVDGRSSLDLLLESADVLLENYRPGVIESMGYGWESVHARWPRLIMASVSGFGQTGPDSGLPAMDVVVQALSGLMSITGFSDRPGVGTPAAVADVSAGMMAANGIMASIIGRQSSGEGCYVDVSMLDVMISVMGRQLGRFANGSMKQPARAGSASPSQAPFDTYACSKHAFPDHIAIIGLNPKHWDSICEVLGDSAIRNNPSYQTPGGRHKAASFKPDLEALLSRRTALEWVQAFQAVGVPCGPVNDLQGVVDNRQAQVMPLMTNAHICLTDS